MAVYGINKEGVDALNQLAKDMKRLNGDIEACGKTLVATVNGLSSELGIYDQQILSLVQSVNQAQSKGREAVETLADSVQKLAEKAQELVQLGLG